MIHNEEAAQDLFEKFLEKNHESLLRRVRSYISNPSRKLAFGDDSDAESILSAVVIKILNGNNVRTFEIDTDTNLVDESKFTALFNSALSSIGLDRIRRVTTRMRHYRSTGRGVFNAVGGASAIYSPDNSNSGVVESGEEEDVSYQEDKSYLDDSFGATNYEEYINIGLDLIKINKCVEIHCHNNDIASRVYRIAFHPMYSNQSSVYKDLMEEFGVSRGTAHKMLSTFISGVSKLFSMKSSDINDRYDRIKAIEMASLIANIECNDEEFEYCDDEDINDLVHDMEELH